MLKALSNASVSTRGSQILQLASTKSAGALQTVPRRPWTRTCTWTSRILQKPSARKCPHKYGKSRFQFLCARINELGFENHLQSNLVPVKIRAIQGHSKEALEKAGGLFANAVLHQM